MASFSQAPLSHSGSGGAREPPAHWGAPAAAAAATPPHFVQPAQGWGSAAARATAAPPFAAAVFHTTETLALESPPSAGADASFYHGWVQPQEWVAAPSPQQWGGPAAAQWGAPAAAEAAQPPPGPQHYMQQLEQQNAELARQCRELQERVEAANAAPSPTAAASTDREASPPPPASTRRRSSQQQGGQRGMPPPSSLAGEPDREEMELLQRRLAAKEREAEAAAAAAAAKQAQAAAREAELEQERGRAAELADQVARWKDECAQRERELRAVQQRLEAAASHAGLLEDGGAALRKKHAELGTALAQRDVTIRQLEDRLRSLQGSEGTKERQLDALHSDGEALRRENSTLRQQVAALQADKQQLEEAVRLAREEVSALQCRNTELAAEAARAAAAAAAAVAVAAPASNTRSSSGAASTAGSGDRYQVRVQPARGYTQQEQQQQQQQQQQQHGYDACAEPGCVATASQATPPPMAAYQWGMPPPYPEQQWGPDPRASLQQLPSAYDAAWQQGYQMPPQQQRQPPLTAVGAPVPHSQVPPARITLQQYNQHAATPLGPAASRYSNKQPGELAGQGGAAAAADASDVCSVSSYATGPAGPSPLPWRLQNDYGSNSITSAMHLAPPAAWQGVARQQQAQQQADVSCAPSPLPWRLQNDYGSSSITPGRYPGASSAGHAALPPHLPATTRTSSEESSARSDTGTEALAGRLGAVSLGAGTPGPAGSPFATEVTLQDMLARTQALEDRLLALNAERNELEAESARMPSHTTGRTLQERKRRAEVERRLEELGRECSSVRLQLRRLGVK
ncbi:hypothetical protein ABPG75_009433 [Micractinium tetrahymenae]